MMKFLLLKIRLKKTLEKRTLESTLAGGLHFILTFIQSITLVPLFLKFWGNDKYGAWLAVFSFVTMLRALDLGHQNFVGTEFQLHYHTDKKKAKTILGSSVRIALLLGFLELMVFLILVLFGLDRKLIGYDAISSPSVRAGIFALVLMWWAVGSLGGILVRVILPLGLYAKSVYLSLIFKILEILVLFFCSFGDTSIFWVCLWYAVASLLYSLFIMWDIKRIMPEFFPWWSDGTWKIGIRNLKKSLVLTFNGLIDQFNANGIVLIISAFLQTAMVPVFTTIRTVTNTVSQLTMLVTGPLVPELIRYHSTGQFEKTQHIFSTNWLISGLIVNLPMVILIPIIQPIYMWWTAGQLEFNYSLFFLLSLSVCLMNFGRSYSNYLIGINYLNALSTITLSRVLVLSFTIAVLLPSKGLIALGWGILLAEIVASWIIPAIFIRHVIKGYKAFSIKRYEWLALLSVGLVAVCYITSFLFPTINTYWTVLVTAILLVMLARIQWMGLDNEVKFRLLSLVNIC